MYINSKPPWSMQQVPDRQGYTVKPCPTNQSNTSLLDFIFTHASSHFTMERSSLTTQSEVGLELFVNFKNIQLLLLLHVFDSLRMEVKDGLVGVGFSFHHGFQGLHSGQSSVQYGRSFCPLNHLARPALALLITLPTFIFFTEVIIQSHPIALTFKDLSSITRLQGGWRHMLSPHIPHLQFLEQWLVYHL